MNPAIYIETSIISYYTARISNNILIASRQVNTADFWENHLQTYRNYVSSAVLAEISVGDSSLIQKRLTVVQNLPLLQDRAEIVELSRMYKDTLNLPDSALVDLVHIAFAVFYEIDYLLTWNMKHIANPNVQTKLSKYNNDNKLFVPMLITPTVIMEMRHGT